MRDQQVPGPAGLLGPAAWACAASAGLDLRSCVMGSSCGGGCAATCVNCFSVVFQLPSKGKGVVEGLRVNAAGQCLLPPLLEVLLSCQC
jgi:hypothetical protein